MNLVDEIKKQLRTRGHMQVTIEDDETAEEWRRAARAAARQLGRPVETLRHRDTVMAALRDWPANDLEQEIHMAAMRKVMNKVALNPNVD